MKYENITKARFLRRLNRFCAEIEIDGKTELCHVKNTGRLKELLTSGAEVFIETHDNTERKTKYSLIAVQKGQSVVNIDSLAPNKVFYEWVKDGLFLQNVTKIKPEAAYKNSRFDCYIEADGKKIFAEVKGVTLERDGVAMFPDAPTQRGVKHLCELCECVSEGYEAYIVFIAAMKGVHTFTPNSKTHKEFADMLARCEKCGVNIVCIDCKVTHDSIKADQRIKVVL